MIILKKLNGSEIVINAELVETVESCGNTVINLVNGNRFIVMETKEEVISKIVEYKKKVYAGKKTIDPLEGLH